MYGKKGLDLYFRCTLGQRDCFRRQISCFRTQVKSSDEGDTPISKLHQHDNVRNKNYDGFNAHHPLYTTSFQWHQNSSSRFARHEFVTTTTRLPWP
ncbi:hypothetical protein TNCV_2816591 [Trichonephila clavipes]|nr:hypothetical protein TNCV_2816591 [Trichonephila clavipes]